jgi:hypothetical protein
MTQSTTLDPRARFWGNIAKWGFLIFACAIFAPFIWLAVGGLVGLVLFVGIATGAWMVRPAVFTLAANTRLKLVKAAAAINPVESLQEEHRRRSVALNDRRAGIETMAGAIKTLKKTIDDLAREFPDDPELPQMLADHQELLSLKQEREQAWLEAHAELGEFEKGIRRASRLWDVSLAAAKARGQSALSEDEWQAKLKTEVAFDTIRSKLDSQLSALSTERLQAEAQRIMRRKSLPTPAAQPAVELPATEAQGQHAAMPPGRDNKPAPQPGRTNA